jgi:2-oxoglutarate ferredoxin oxidoreductase subunit alpha
LQLRAQGAAVSAAQLRYLNPMPQTIGNLMKNFRQVLVPEMNLGQLRMLLRARFLVDAKGLNKVRGQPFTISEIVRAAVALLPPSNS